MRDAASTQEQGGRAEAQQSYRAPRCRDRAGHRPGVLVGPRIQPLGTRLTPSWVPPVCALHGGANSAPWCHRAKLVPTTFISAMPGSAAHSLRRAVAPSALRSPLGPHCTAPCTGQSCGAGWLRAAGPLGHLHTAGRGQAGSLGGN